MKRIFLLIILISLFSNIVFSQTVEQVRIGVFADMTGATSFFGQSTLNGVKMAVDEINTTDPINGKWLTIFLEDDQGRPEAARAAVKTLIEQKKVHIILGEVASTNSLAAAPIAQTAGIPMIMPASTNPKVTEVGDYIFRTCFIHPLQGEAMGKFAFNQLKARRVAILGDDTSDYSKGLTEKFRATFTKLGGKIVADELYTQNDPDFRGQLFKIRARKPDAIYLPGYYSQTGEIAKEARRLKMMMPLLGGDGWDSPELWKIGGAALNNSYITNHFADDDQDAKVQEFVQKHKAKFGVKPDSLAALAYDAVYVLADALRRAGTTDGQKLRDAIAGTKNFSGVSGKILEFDKNRNAVKPVVVLKLNPKEYRFIYNSTIEP